MSSQIIQGDCLEVLPTLPDGSVDLTLTSPPFKDEDVSGDYYEIYGQWMDEILRVTAKAAVIINSATRINEIIKRWPPKRTMVWGKGISQYSWRWNPIFVYQLSDDYKVNKYIWSDSFGVEAITGKWKVHKYQDPLLLYSTIIKMFRGCNSVLDPFMGSGTTATACTENSRDFIGIEIDPHKFAIVKQQMRLPL